MRRLAWTLLTCGLCFTASADAQVGPGARALDARAVADSQRVLRTLDDAVRRNPRDAAAWHRRGMIAWALAERAGAGPRLSGLDEGRMRGLADSSLRRAVLADPATDAYQAAVTEFMRQSSDMWTRRASVVVIDAALEAARRGSDSAALSRAAVEAGRVRWRRYENVPDRAFPCELLPASIDGAAVVGFERLLTTVDQTMSQASRMAAEDMFIPVDIRIPSEYAMKRLGSFVDDCLHTDRQLFDGIDYDRAELLFREAHAAAPSDERAFRHLAMLLAERRRWGELEGVARTFLDRAGSSGWGHLALGLARHRGGNMDGAAATLDTGVALLDPSERTRLFQITRLLTPADSASYARAGAAERAAMERSFWSLSDPLWTRPGNDSRAEFLARVTYAELRWTVEELGVRGADTDRGMIHIRYGPPGKVIAFRGSDFMPYGNPQLTEGPPRSPLEPLPPRELTMGPGITHIVTFWVYANGLTVVFWGYPMSGTAEFPLLDREHVAVAIDARPAAFDNVAGERIVDLPMRLARFRGAGDSVDVALHVLPPVAELLAGSIVDGKLRADGWLFPRDYPTGIRDSLDISEAGVLTRVYRLAPSNWFYRVEVTKDASTVAARSSGWITVGADTAGGFSTRGFGLSDVVIASALDARAGVPARWRDFNVTPLFGAVPVDGQLHLLWETYELAARASDASYAVTVTLERERARGGQIVAAVLGALQAASRVDRADNRVVIRFDRVVPHRPVLVDALSLGLAGSPPGTYRLTVEVEDSVTRRRVSATSSFVIAR